jgi:hypothetical protein
MKKVKFTLSVMLTMLFGGASVVNAQQDMLFGGASVVYAQQNVNRPHDGVMDLYLEVKACEFYSKNAVEFEIGAIDPRGFYRYNAAYPIEKLSASSLKENDFRLTKLWFAWRYGVQGYDFNIDETESSPGYLNYYYDQTPPLSSPQQNVLAGLFYYQKKSAEVYNIIRVQLDYKNGNDLMPVIKRTITLGEWEYNGDKECNELSSAQELSTFNNLDDTPHFLPDMDNKSGIATFTYKDDVLALLAQYPAIKSIKYEIAIHDEVGSGGNHQPPVNTDNTIMRCPTIKTEDGITTDRNDGFCTESQKDLVFTVYCNEEIEVTTTRGNDEQGVRIENNGDGSYKVTIRQVKSNFTIFVKKLIIAESGTGGENGETLNTAIMKDAVWAAGGTLYVNTVNAGTLAIYNVTGQLYKSENISGNYTLSMPKGVYIVQLNGKAYKVVL